MTPPPERAPRGETTSNLGSKPDSAAGWLWRRRYLLCYLALSAWFVLGIARVHDRETGFTSLLIFGDTFAPQRLQRLRDVPVYIFPHSAGYDGQFYAQVAVAGNPFDPELRTALDNPGYRARRVLLPLLAHVAGFGRPGWVLTAYALSNLLCWLALACVSARWWFPPVSLNNLARWGGTLFGAGLLVSVVRSLTDGPALLLIALGVRCVEVHRRWLGAGILAAAGLVRETSVLAAASLWARDEEGSGAGRARWRRALLAAAIVILPTVLWIAAVSLYYRAASTGALALPGTGFSREAHRIVATVRARGVLAAKGDIFVVVATAVQVAYLLARPRKSEPWWRVGVGFAVLAWFLGWDFWEDAMSGVPRTLLPLTLAFNVLVPRTRVGWALLVAGNLTVLSASTVLGVLPVERTSFADGIKLDYVSGWHGPEHSGQRTWRWSSGSASVKLHSPQPGPVWVRLDFGLQSQLDRTITLRARDLQRELRLVAAHGLPTTFGPFELPPGDTALLIETPEPPWTEPGPRGRPLAFALQNFRLEVVPPPPSPPGSAR